MGAFQNLRQAELKAACDIDVPGVPAGPVGLLGMDCGPMSLEPCMGQAELAQPGHVLPLFVSDESFAMPGLTFSMNLVEARHQAMARRCLDENGGCFVIVGSGEDENQLRIGCQVQITGARRFEQAFSSCVGAVKVQVRAMCRVLVHADWPNQAEEGSYQMARVSVVVDDDDDDMQAPESWDSDEDEDELGRATEMAYDSKRNGVTVAQLSDLAQAWMGRWLQRGKELATHSPKMLQLFLRLTQRAGRPPEQTTSAAQQEAYTFWVANLVPTSRGDRRIMLSCRSTRVRIFFVVSLLKQAIAQVEGRERVVKRYARRRPSKAVARMCR